MEFIQGQVVEFTCSKCGSKDHDRQTYSPAPIALTCYNCGAGRNMPIPEMLQTNQGMFRLPEKYY